MTVLPRGNRRSDAAPVYATRRRPGRDSIGPRLGKVSTLLGQPPMPWQQFVYDVAGELDADGLPAYREVVVTVMRQSGKTTVTLTWELDRCLSWDTPQVVAYSAQTGWDARRKLLDDQVPLIERSDDLAPLLSKVRRSQGAEGVNFTTGSRIDVLASGPAAGHGRVVDLGVIDEAFNDEDDRREGSIKPAQATRADAQLLIVSTAGTDTSLYLRHKVEVGRAAALADSGTGTAYFEWAIPPDADADDPETWWRHMPALGWTISQPVVAQARQSMADPEWRRAFGNQWVAAQTERLIPETLWLQACSTTAAPDPARVTFAVDLSDDRGSAAIVACDGEAAELVQHRPGTGWVVDWLTERAERYGAEVVVDGGGPAGHIASDLTKAGVRVVKFNTADLAAACGRFYDDLADGRLVVRTHPELDASAATIARRPLADRWIWSRSASRGDATPIVAVTMAWHHARTRPQVGLSSMIH